MANAQLDYKFLPTHRGGRYLCLNGYMFVVNKRKREELISWKCAKKDCRTTVSTTNDIITKMPGDHNHEPVYNEIKVKETLQRMKVKARTTLQPMPSLYNDLATGFRDGAWTDESRELAGSMPTYHSVKNQLYRARQAVFPGLPSQRRTITFPEEYQKTNSGEQFLLIDDGDDDKIIGFTTRSNLEYLCASDVMYGDGTFYVSPKLFTQLYTIHAKVSGQVFPLVFLLLPNKTRDTYTRAFRLVKETAASFGFQLNPDKVQMDFEMAARNAALTVFPTTTWKGCFFHYTQCIWRKVQKCGLQVDYKNDFEVSKFVRRCAGLPLVPERHVEDVWLHAMGEKPDDARVTQVADYVTTHWIEGDLTLGEWNHFGTDGPRTNNNLEGWHGRLKKVVGKQHPNIFELAKFLANEQDINEVKMLQYVAGQRLPPKKKKYTDLERRLDIYKQGLENGTMSLIEYLDNASYSVKLFSS